MKVVPHLQNRPNQLGPLCRNGHDDGGGSMRFLREDPRKDLRNRCVLCEMELYNRRSSKPVKSPQTQLAESLFDGMAPPIEAPVDDTPPRKPLPAEHRDAVHAVAEEVAKFYTARFHVQYEDLLQEAWVHALDAHASYWGRADLDHSIKGMRGWVYRWVRVRLAMYTRKATCPVSFPKKAVPDTIRDGVRTVPVDSLAVADRFDMFAEISQEEERRIVDRTMGDALRKWPLARMVIREAATATSVAAGLSDGDIIKEVRRQAAEAKRFIENRLEAVLSTPTTKESDACQSPDRTADRCALGYADPRTT